MLISKMKDRREFRKVKRGHSMQQKKTDQALILANPSGAPSPPVSRKALSKIEHVRAELANVYRQARVGNIDMADATKMAYILSILAKLIETNDLERRIELLEKETKR
jgi:hypothetical protein